MSGGNKMRKCVGKEAFLRMNYLYQISNVALKSNQNVASNFYSSLMILVAKKTVQRIEPGIKRTVCKKCHLLLIPGVTCKVRVKKKVVNYTCTQCMLQKSFQAKKDYCLWVDRPEAVVEILDYNASNKKS